jgi:hypothetical protein
MPPAPPLTGEDEIVLGDIQRMRRDLRHVLRTPRRWEGGLRRSALARNIQGSNSIEGYEVAEDDAAVMIHPFLDGNERMARALATLVLTRSDIGEPEFSSIEEWLGANTDDYYRVRAHTGHGSWQPRPDPHLWVAFSLRAHHMQAQTVARRMSEAGATWEELDRLAAEHAIPERALDPMFDAALGYRVRRGGYVNRAGVTEQTATRDLAGLVSAGILVARGNGRGRYYVAGPPVREIRERRRSGRSPLHDPYPWMRAKLAEMP